MLKGLLKGGINQIKYKKKFSTYNPVVVMFFCIFWKTKINLLIIS